MTQPTTEELRQAQEAAVRRKHPHLSAADVTARVAADAAKEFKAGVVATAAVRAGSQGPAKAQVWVKPRASALKVGAKHKAKLRTMTTDDGVELTAGAAAYAQGSMPSLTK